MSKERSWGCDRLLLSLFCGCGGLDQGFERAGFTFGLAYDLRPNSVCSWNANRPHSKVAYSRDVRTLTPSDFDMDYGGRFAPRGVVGGPPCQSFTKANSRKLDFDPRTELVGQFVSTALKLHGTRGGLDFIVMENVPELESAANGTLLDAEIRRLEDAYFNVTVLRLNALKFGVAQNRERLFLIALSRDSLGDVELAAPMPSEERFTVQDVIGNLPDPVVFRDHVRGAKIPFHPNHWCMTPKSSKFFDGTLKPGYSSGRSFKTLDWNKPSFSVSYGHREVHVHPLGKRRLSVFEGMLLQGFPEKFILEGTLSDQIDQVSEAVPPPLATAVALAVRDAMLSSKSARDAVCERYGWIESSTYAA